MRKALFLLLLLGCHRQPAVAPEQVRQRFAEAIRARHLESIVRVEGDELIHAAPGQPEQRYPLKAGYDLCARSVAKCDLYVGRVVGVFQDSVDHEHH